MDESTRLREALWTVPDVAAFLRVSKSWVYHHAEDGTLPSLRIGGMRRFDPAQIHAYARGEPIPPASVVPFGERRR